MLSQPNIKLGGDNKVIQSDETYYSKNYCVLGAIEESSKKVILKRINGPTIENIDTFVTNFFLPNSILVSDSHSSYSNISHRLPGIIINHQTVNHSIHEFRNPEGFTINLIESVWIELKRFCPSPGDINHLAVMVDIFMFKKTTT